MIFQVRTDNHVKNSAGFSESIRVDDEAAIEPRSADVEAAVAGAVARVLRVIEKQLGRQDDRAGRASAAGEGA